MSIFKENKPLFVLLLFSLVYPFIACKKECKDTSRIYNENYLTLEQRSYVPLDKPEWDSITFLKNGKDTVTLYKISVDSTTLFEPIEQYHAMSEPAYPNCNRVYQRYQNIKYTYRNDKTKDYMVVYLILELKSNLFENDFEQVFSKTTFINFNNLKVGAQWASFQTNSNYFVGDFYQFNLTYKNCIRSDDGLSKGYLNKEKFLIRIENQDKSIYYQLLEL